MIPVILMDIDDDLELTIGLSSRHHEIAGSLEKRADHSPDVKANNIFVALRRHLFSPPHITRVLFEIEYGNCLLG
jgi:hypothetical protein